MVSNKGESYKSYRTPPGAVPDGVFVDIYFSFDYNNSDDIKNVKLAVICNDNDSEIKYYAMNKNGSDFSFSYSLEVSKGLYFYWFEFDDQSTQKWQITVYDKNFKTPDLFKGGIMYHIFVDRFARSDSWNPEVRDGFYMHGSLDETPFYKPDENGILRNNDIYGGSLQGIIEKLDYLKELCVDIIYLSPVFEANSNHKYNTADFTKIDSMFGNDEIFDELIRQADSRGMKIIFDGVFNHTGNDSVYFNRYGKYNSLGAYQSKDSEYYDWYNFSDWDSDREDYDCWWGVKSLPSIKKDQPVFRAFICGVNGIIEKWLKRGIAGYRIDVADELSDRMLRGINKAVKETSLDNIIIGEVWDDASNKTAYGQRRQYLLGNQLDSVMNYPLKDAVINYLRTGNSKVMTEVMDMITNNYPKQSIDCLMNIIGTHDTMRILTALGTKTENFADEKDKDKMAEAKLSPDERINGIFLLKAAVLMQMTLPGIPCIYYGDEAGLEGYGDPFCRRFFPWDNIDSDIHDFYKKICKVRKENKDIFADGEYKLVSEESGLFFYKRIKYGEKRGEIYAYVNLSEKAYDLTDLADVFISLLTGEEVMKSESGSFDVLKKVESLRNS